MNYKNVAVSDRQVTITKPFKIIPGVIATLIFGIFLYALVEDGFPLRHTRTPYLVVFVAATLIWLWYVARLKTTTVFDAESGTIRRKNLFGLGKTLRFDQVADVTLVVKDEGCWQGEYFKLSPKNNRFGKGYILTKTYSDFDEELEHLRHGVVPELRRMLGVVEEGTAATDAQPEERRKQTDTPTLPEAPRFFSKSGGVYSRRFWRQITFYSVLALGFIVWGLADKNYIAAGLGAVFLIAACCFPAKVSLDTDTNTVRLFLCFGFWQRHVIPFSQFVTIGSTRSSTNGIYNGTSLEMHFSGKTKNVTLARVYFTGGLDGLATEAETIVTASLAKTANS
jgi:hypothetical protein